MLSKCIFLIDDPNHSSTLQHLKLDIQAAYNTIDDMLQDTQDIINQMDNFSNNITPLANELENLSNRAYNDRQIDSEKVIIASTCRATNCLFAVHRKKHVQAGDGRKKDSGNYNI